jgi:hypothetical protein
MGNQQNTLVMESNIIEEYIESRRSRRVLPASFLPAKLLVLCPQQDPASYSFLNRYAESSLEALLDSFPTTPLALQYALILARNHLGPELFRLPGRNGINLPSIAQPGMFYVSEYWAQQYQIGNELGIDAEVEQAFGIVGANNTTSSSIVSNEVSVTSEQD